MDTIEFGVYAHTLPDMQKLTTSSVGGYAL